MSEWNGGPDGPGSGQGDAGNAGRGIGWSSPPILNLLPGEPRYAAQDVARHLRIPPNQLWEWEQTIQVPRPIRVPDGHGGMVPRYSERDVAAVRWLLEQVNAGTTLLEAALRLLAAQGMMPSAAQPRTGMGASPRDGSSGPLARGPSTSASGLYPPTTPSLRGTSGPLAGSGQLGHGSSGPLGRTVRPGSPSGALGQPGPFATVSGPLNSAVRYGPPSSTLGSLGQHDPTSRPLGFGPSSSFAGVPMPGQPPVGFPARPPGIGQGHASNSGPLRPGGMGAPPTSRLGADNTGSGWRGPAVHSTVGLHMLQAGMLRAFATMDVDELARLLDGALGEYAVEPVCMELLQPVIVRAGEMRHAGQLSDGEFQFGVVTVRNRLAALLDATALPPEGPLALLACAPGEHHEVGPLTLAILWRLAGLRAIYLGADLSEEALLIEAQRRQPVLVCLSAATEAGARAIGHAAGSFARLSPPRPWLVYDGGVFARQPDLQRRIKDRDALFLGVDAVLATRHVVRLLNDGPLTP